MPNYDFICQQCRHQEERFQKMDAPSLILCPKCKKESFQKQVGAGLGLHFKGSGFYITDYNASSKDPKNSG